MTHFHVRKQPLITRQDVFYALTLIAIALWFCFVPTLSIGQLPGQPLGQQPLGQPPLGLVGNEPFGTLETPFDPQPAPTTFDPATMSAIPIMAEIPEPSAPLAPAVAPPTPTVAETSPITANQFSTMIPPPSQPLPQQNLPQQGLPQQSLLQQSFQREVAAPIEHPFRQYWGTPNDPHTRITGKPMTVAELFAGTRSSIVRTQLLQSYWELSGLLAIYHFRCEAERLASGAAGQQPDTMALLHEQRRTAEVEFIKQQWVLAELLKQHKGRTLRASELPIPADYPLYPKYQTHADRIARTERTRHLGRMIPIQEQLIETKNGSWRAASAMVPNASQPFFVVSNQRTIAFLGLTRAIVDYNKMIAEYALETIPPHVSPQQLVGAVVRLPRSSEVQEQPQALQRSTEERGTEEMATEGIRLAQYEAPVGIQAEVAQQVGHEYEYQRQRMEFQPPSSLSMPIPTVVETEESELTPAPPSFLMMDF